MRDTGMILNIQITILYEVSFVKSTKFYYASLGNGNFSKSFCTSRKDYSRASLDWLNFVWNDPKFDGTIMRSVINGEMTIGGYKCDGVIKTKDGETYIFEYNGC